MKGDKADGQGYSSDIGARGGVAAGMDKYYVSRAIPVSCLVLAHPDLLYPTSSPVP
jgi:hypothetical protein